MNIYPNTQCATFCTWLLANTNIRLTPARKIQVQNVQTAANTGGTVTQLYFESFVAYTNRFYQQYVQYAAQNPTAPPPTTYDPLTTTWLTYVTSPSQQTIYAVDAFFKQLRADGNLAIDYLFLTAQDQQANAKISLFNPGTFTYTEVGTPTWAANLGYTGNGSSMYLQTNYTDSTSGINFVLNSGAMGCYTRLSKGTQTAVAMGSDDNTHASYIYLNIATAGKRMIINALTNTDYANTNTQGLTVAQRTASNANAIWLNGTQLTTSTVASVGYSTKADYLMCLNYNGTPAQYETNQFALFFKSGGGLNMATFYSAVNLLMTNIGAHY